MTDRYTKIVLTVIAIMLTVMAVRDLTPAVAQTPVTHVILDKVETLVRGRACAV
jgi:hypothetical protein